MAEACAFCGRDPYEYVDNGVGMERVAVTCCELGCATYDHRDNPDHEIVVTVADLRDMANKLHALEWQVERRNRTIGKLWLRRN